MDPIDILKEISELGDDRQSARALWDRYVASHPEPEDICFVWDYLDSKLRAFLKDAPRVCVQEPDHKPYVLTYLDTHG